MTLGPLTKAYGPEIRNTYTGNPLNRLSFLRGDTIFLRQCIQHASTLFLAFNNLEPLTIKSSQDDDLNNPVYLKYSELQSILPSDLYAYESESEESKNWDSKIPRPTVVFLGVDESKHEVGFHYKAYKGQPYFAIDLSGVWFSKSNPQYAAKLELLSGSVLASSENRRFAKGRVAFSQSHEYAIFAQARMYIDWNSRNRFCGGCGNKTMSGEAGCKLVCPDFDQGLATEPCPTRGTITNLSFPRTDCVVIVGVVNHAGDRILIGRNKRYPSNLYSCLAGFMEPAESVEECVRREVWEESGVKAGRVHIHSTQPWPYPANIMIGCIAEVAHDSEDSHKIHLLHDPELVDAKWVDFAKIRNALNGTDVSEFSLPPKEAIAHTILNAIVNGSALTGSKPMI